MIRRTWNTTASCWIELWRDEVDGQVYEGRNQQHVPAGLADLCRDIDCCYELEIQFTSRGYFEPASMYGGPQHVGWPADGDDERTLNHVLLHSDIGDKHQTTVIRQPLADELFGFFSSAVEATELPDRDYD